MIKWTKKQIGYAIVGLVALALLIWGLWAWIKHANTQKSASSTKPGSDTTSGSGGSGSGTGSGSGSGTGSVTGGLYMDNNFPLKLGSGDGNGGDRVKQLQKYLNGGAKAQGLTTISEDGKFGNSTLYLVNWFKKKNNLVDNGQISKQEFDTWIVPMNNSEDWDAWWDGLFEF